MVDTGGYPRELEKVMGDILWVDMVGILVVVTVDIAALVVAAEDIMVGVAGDAHSLVRLWRLSP